MEHSGTQWNTVEHSAESKGDRNSFSDTEERQSGLAAADGKGIKSILGSLFRIYNPNFAVRGILAYIHCSLRACEAPGESISNCVAKFRK